MTSSAEVDALTREAAHLDAQAELLGRLVRGDQLEGFLHELCVRWEELLPGAMCSVLVLDRAAQTLSCGAAPSLPSEYVAALDGMAVGAAAGSCGTAIHTSHPVLVSDISSDPRWTAFQALAAEHGIKACWSFPLIPRQGEPAGTFAVSLAEARAPAARDLQLLDIGAKLASLALEHAAEQEAHSLYAAMTAESQEMMAYVDLEFVLRAANRSYLSFYGLERDRVIGQRVSDVYGEKYFKAITQAWHERCHKGETVSQQVWAEHPAFGRRFLDINYVPARDRHGQITGVIVSFRDLSDRERALENLRLSEARFRDFAQTAADWFWETDAEHRFTYLSGRFEEVTGLPAQSLIGSSVEEYLQRMGADASRYQQHLECMQDNHPFESFVFEAVREGERHTHAMSGRPKHGGDGGFRGYRGTGSDVTHEHQLRQKMVHLATHDSLTGLVNRHEFDVRLNRALNSAREHGGEHALCYMDLDQFKLINDTCGHGAGDELLRQIAGVMLDRVRARDTLARLGGDEFGIIMEHCQLSQALGVAEALRQSIADHRLHWEGHTFGVGVSIGLVAIGPYSSSSEELMADVDSACYLAKEQGRNRIHVYQPDDQDAAVRRGEILSANRLQQALDEDGFELFIQSIRAARAQDEQSEEGGELGEVLLRMRGSEGELVSADGFLPAAERYHLAARVDQWVVRHVFEWIARTPEVAARFERIFINLSAQSLSDPRACDFVLAELRRCGIEPGLICFEVTETAATLNVSRARHFMATLGEQGCKFALDDFGSGLCTFAYLKELPVDYLKIDGMFVSDVAGDPVDRSIVQSVNDVGHVMGKRTIAEHVEGEAVLDILREIGVDYVQGYLFDRPAPLIEKI